MTNRSGNTNRGAAEPRPYAFDRVFGPDPSGGLSPNARAFEDGRQWGRDEANEEAADRQAEALEGIIEELRSLEIAGDAQWQLVEQEAVRLALAIGRTLAGEALAAYPTSVLETTARECLSRLRAVPSVTIAVAPSLAFSARELVSATAQTVGYEGEITITADAGLSALDCRVEWASGAILRDHTAIAAEIEAVVRERLQDLEPRGHGAGIAANTAEPVEETGTPADADEGDDV